MKGRTGPCLRAFPPAVTNFGYAKVSDSGERPERPSRLPPAGNRRYTHPISAHQQMPADDPPSFLPVPALQLALDTRRSVTARLRSLFPLLPRAPRSAGTERLRSPAAGLYVDGENLPGDVPARRLITQILDDWPSDRPPLRMLSAYVPANKTTLWEAWCADRLPEALVRVRGVQRFRRETSKNSADLALAADAAVDFALGTVQFVAVLSSDSDFVSLYAKVAELAAAMPSAPVHAPFLWITPSNGSPVSNEALDYFPERLRWTVPLDTPGTPGAQGDLAKGDEPTAEIVAATLLASFPDSKKSFRTSDVRPIIAKHWPKHPAATNPSVCGTFLLNEVYPVLEKRGVKIVPGTSPRTYELRR